MIKIPQNRRRNNKNLFSRILIILLCIFIFLMIFTSFPQKVFNGIELVSIKAFENKKFLGKRLNSIFIDKENILEEKENLEKELFFTKIQIFLLPDFKRENEELKKLLKLKEESNEELIFSNILSRPPRSIYNTVIINKGSKEGIKPEAEVFANEVSIGKILEVFDNSSKVQLWTSNNLETEIILSPQNINLIAKGNGNNLEIQVPRDMEINEGDLVFNSNSKQIIGIVEKIIFDPKDTFQIALLASVVNLSEVEILIISK